MNSLLKKMVHMLAVILVALSSGLFLAGCETDTNGNGDGEGYESVEEGAEETGEAVEEGAEETGETIEEGTDNM